MRVAHRHLTVEACELALEEQPARRGRLLEQARDCPTCATVLGEASLAPILARWQLPGALDRPVDWRPALRRAIAPTSQRSGERPRHRFPLPTLGERPRHRWRLPAVGALVAGLLLATTLPAAASAGADSRLFAVRGWEEDARWSVTPEADRAELDANLASAYLWLARMSAGRQDRAGYEATMARFFTWGAHLKADIRRAPTAERSRARASVATAMSLVSGLETSGGNPTEARSAGSLLNDVENASQEGSDQHQVSPGPSGGSPGQQDQTGSAGAGGSSQAGEQPGNTSGSSGAGGGQDGP
jgi:hypothetical protein